MDEIEANRLVSVVAVSLLIITALFIFSVSRVEVSVSESKSGWIAISSGANTSASLSHVNSTYKITNDFDANSTTIAGAVSEAFTASHESSNLTYGIDFLFWFPHGEYPVHVYMNATLISAIPVRIYNFSFYDPGGFMGLYLGSLNDARSFNNTSLEQYTFAISWSVTITFVNSSLLDAQFFCNASLSYTFPNLVAVNIPSSIGYTSLVGAAVGVVIISAIYRAWNRPKIVDDSTA